MNILRQKKYNHSKQGWKEVCQCYILPALPSKSDLGRKSDRFMDSKMNKKVQINLRALQVKSVWKAKIEHIISKSNVNQGANREDKDDHEHMFTYPFRTVDNSLHHSCMGLPEFSHYTET